MTNGDGPITPVDEKYLNKGQVVLAAGGVVFIYGAVTVFGLACYRLFKDEKTRNPMLENYTSEIIMCAIGVFAAILGVRLLRSIGLGKNQQPARVINKEEWDILCNKVSDGNEEAVTQYIRLTSLGGFTGTFTKLGLTGLPLATIGLTLFFSLLAISYPDVFLDLTKLTLGAFIGSFVQKQVGATQGASVKLPSGETLKVQAPPEDIMV